MKTLLMVCILCCVGCAASAQNVTVFSEPYPGGTFIVCDSVNDARSRSVEEWAALFCVHYAVPKLDALKSAVADYLDACIWSPDQLPVSEESALAYSDRCAPKLKALMEAVK